MAELLVGRDEMTDLVFHGSSRVISCARVRQ